MRKYNAYKDSGVEWIGEIPATWKIKRIKHTTYVKGRIGWKGLRSDEFLEESDSYVVTGTDFKNGKIKWETCYQVPKDRYDDDPFIQLREDDLLITKDGTIGKIAVVKNLPKIATLNSGVFLTRPKSDDYISEYLYWVLESDVFKTFYDFNKSGSTIQHLYQNVFNEFKFTCPTLQEQLTIAKFLDFKTSQLDKLISKKRALIKLLKEERTVIINQAVTKGLNPNVPMKNSGIEWLGQVPKHWEIKPLKYIVEFNSKTLSENTPLDEEINYIEIGNVSSTKGISEYTKYIFKDAPSRARRIVSNGDVIVSTVRTYLKAIASIDNKFDGFIASTGFAVLTPTSIISTYLAFLVRNEGFIGKIIALSKGVSYPSITTYDLGNLKVPLPPENEQLEISKYISKSFNDIDRTLNIINKEISFLIEYKTTLINEVVTGKIDVREEALN
ncbi:type I restriction enzyme, S subunit [Flaviramulus basaltis]|uniref:Type I restriction enzyme, S subunit n=1 Tax=Flaviramulus basaltis TaxID=369401 RepID=A0A1K2IPR8_9FLAO|nr:restriction endonuclease subunit S [Flaviramulus basaltis]SFZ94436.1 type I restriction enzyme, S subunit [Flaviramulus basaltis]